MKRALASLLFLLLLLLPGCGTVVPLPHEAAPETEAALPQPEENEAESPAPVEGADEPTPAEESEEPPQPAPEEEEGSSQPTPAEEGAEAPLPEPEEAPEDSLTEAPSEETPEEAEETPEEEEPVPEPEQEGESSPRAVIKLTREETLFHAGEEEIVLLRVQTEQPRLTLLGLPLRIEAQINRSLEEDLSTLTGALAAEDGSGVLLENAWALYDSMKELGREAEFPSYLLSRSVEVPRCDSRVLSLLYVDEIHAEGSHGARMLHGANYSLEDGSLLRFSELSSDADALRERCAAFVDWTLQTEYEGELLPDYPALLPALLADPNWYFSSEGLVVLANDYVLSAAALGGLRFTIPYDVIEDLLDPGLLPIERPETPGRISAASAEAGEETFLFSCGEGPGTLCLLAEGTVYDLELCSLRYAYQGEGLFRPEPERLLWRCGRLEDGETLLLDSLDPSDLPTLSLRCCGGDGAAFTRLLGVTESGNLILYGE